MWSKIARLWSWAFLSKDVYRPAPWSLTTYLLPPGHKHIGYFLRSFPTHCNSRWWCQCHPCTSSMLTLRWDARGTLSSGTCYSREHKLLMNSHSIRQRVVIMLKIKWHGQAEERDLTFLGEDQARSLEDIESGLSHEGWMGFDQRKQGRRAF